MGKIVAFLAPVVVGIAAGCVQAAISTNTTSAWYQLNLRRDFFTAFITLAGFFLSMTTFIVVKVKEGVYDTDAYKGVLDARKDVAAVVSGPRSLRPSAPYDQLRALCALLVCTVAACFVVSVMHVTVVFIDVSWVVHVCVGAVAAALTFAVVSMSAAYISFRAWIDFAEEGHAARKT